jgi:hypothetical protein
MRLGGRRPGFGTAFSDAFSADVLLKVLTDDSGANLVSFRLYDCRGEMVAESEGLQTFAGGKEIRDQQDELLLLIPSEPEACLEYRLYSSLGTLLTCSDGARTQLFGGIRVDGISPKSVGTRRPPEKEA